MPRPDWSGRAALAGPQLNKLLLLGLGNDILCDDAIGLNIVRQLRPRLTGFEGVEVGESCEMGLALLDYIVGYESLVLADAIQTGRAAPGFVHELEGQDLKVLPVTSPHLVGVGEMMQVGAHLGMPVPKRVKIFAIEVQDPFTITTQMTPALQAAMPAIADRIFAVVQTWDNPRKIG